MSQIPNENDDDNHSIAASDFVQFDQPDELANQQEAQHQQQGQQHFGLHQTPLDWTMNMEGTSNNCNDLKELKWMMANLQAKNQTLQKAVENLELKAEIRALKENAEQKANYQALETKFARQMEQLEAKNRKLEEKLNNVELQTNGTTENGVFDGKIEQLKDEFAKMFSDKQKQMMAQFEAQNNSLEQKLKEAEQRAQMEKNKFEALIHANEQKMEKIQKEIEENGNAIGGNKLKLDYIWGQLMIKGKKLANPKGNAWSGLKTKASISEFGLKTSTDETYQYVFATEGFAISGEQCRKNNFPFPGTIVFYYEVTITIGSVYSCLRSVGFSDGNEGSHAASNSYAIHRTDDGNNTYDYWLSGKQHEFECPIVTGRGEVVVGSGLLLNSKNEWAVFFTRNAILLGKPSLINPTVDRLYPTVRIYNNSVVANFGDNLGVKPFKFDIDNCSGLVFE